jgi:hypothetical protein
MGSCSACPLSLVLFRMSFSFLFPAVMCWQRCPGHPVLEALSWQSCPGVPYWQSCSAYPFLPFLFCRSCSACPVLPVKFCLSKSACPLLFCLSSLFGPARLPCLISPVEAALSWQPWSRQSRVETKMRFQIFAKSEN